MHGGREIQEASLRGAGEGMRELSPDVAWGTASLARDPALIQSKSEMVKLWILYREGERRVKPLGPEAARNGREKDTKGGSVRGIRRRVDEAAAAEGLLTKVDQQAGALPRLLQVAQALLAILSEQPGARLHLQEQFIGVVPDAEIHL